MTDFNISGMAMGVIATCCGYGADGKKSNYDCIQIPGVSKLAGTMLNAAMGICGRSGLVSAAGNTNVTLCCKRLFVIPISS